MAEMRFWHTAWAGSGKVRFLRWAALVLLCAAIGLWVWLGGGVADYRVLFSGLPDKEAGQVIAALDRLDIPYRLNDRDGSIEVPGDRQHLARYRLAIAGVPNSAGEEEAQSAMRFGLSSFQEQLARQRTLEAELAKSIELFEGVVAARVHLALPRQSAFLREPVLPAASVMLTLADGVMLSQPQLEAVRKMVAGSVPAMQVAQVSVLDRHGVLLTGEATALELLPPPAERSSLTVRPAQAQLEQPHPVSLLSDKIKPWVAAWRVEVLPGALGILALLGLWWAMRWHRMKQQVLEQADQTVQDLEQDLNDLRQHVAQNPRLTAGVIKLWMQGI